jgi:hypothetical protein
MAMSHIQMHDVMRCKIVYKYVTSNIGSSVGCRRYSYRFFYIWFLNAVFSPGTSEEVTVSMKQNGVCIVEASDNVPRQIQDCPYEEGQRITIVYKYEQPAIESHSPA